MYWCAPGAIEVACIVRAWKDGTESVWDEDEESRAILEAV